MATSPPPSAAPPVLAKRLIRVIFGCYFVVAAALTAVQLAVEYDDAHEHLQRDVAALERTFGPGLEDALWRFNGEVLRGILAGMREIPVVVGAEVRDEAGRRLEAVGSVDEAGAAGSSRAGGLGTPFSRRFELVHVDEAGRRYPVGSWTVFSDTGIAVEQVRRTLVVILINSAIKTLMLWFIFVAVIRWMIGRPLAQIGAHLARLDREALTEPSAEPLVLRGTGRGELHAMVAALNATTARLRGAFAERDALMRDLTEMNATLQARVAARTRELEALAATDQLTGLPNRRRLDAALDAALEAPGGLAVIVCDIDQFKAINDQHGHKVGDAVLAAFAGILAQAREAGDTVGRWGGEEFLLVCPGADLTAARARAEALRRCIEASALPFVGPRTCSFGVAARRPGESADGLVARADAALYRAKRSGRNRVDVAEGDEGAARDAA